MKISVFRVIKPVLFLWALVAASIVYAQPRQGYYSSAEGKAERTLKTALYDIIKGHTVVSYADLYDVYQTSDITADGKVWDMYSTCTWTPGQKKCGNYSNVCDCYNREHSIPQSWFDEKSPMVSDAFHIYPTDGKVNGQRSNYPFGECGSGSVLNNGKGRLGTSTFAGYSGTVFEPDNEYKGDFARTYFYFATRYENSMTTIEGASFSGNTYPALSSWSVSLFL
ncbi:MAG: endonuclease, partial [Prevotellaceae bacterium]|nr:endonuclease [Prevotellaceae bacterium]